MERKLEGVLLEFNKPNQNGRIYDENSIQQFRSFGNLDLILTHASEEEAIKNELHTVIARAKIKADDKKLYYEISFLNTVPTDKFLEAHGKNLKKLVFVPYIENNELVSVHALVNKKKI